MRVLHVGKYFPPFAGGMENFLADLAVAQQQAGHELRVLVHDHAGSDQSAPPLDGLQVERAPTWGTLFFVPISPSFRARLGRTVDQFKPHLIHFHLPNPSAFWALTLPQARKVPWVVQWQSDVVPSSHHLALRLGYRFYRPWEQRFLRHCQRVIVATPGYLDGSAPLHRWHDRCRVIPLGMDPQRLSCDQATMDWANEQWPSDGLKLLAIGRLTYYKGFSYLLDAVQTVAECQLILVGQGQQLSALQGQLEQLGLSQRVRILTNVNDHRRNALLHSAQAVCLPSIERSEAYGMVLLEAAFCGKPVIATELAGSGVSWVVGQGQHGLMVTPADAPALAKAIGQLQQNPKQRQVLGDNGHTNFARYFHIHGIEQAVDEVYRQCVDST